MSSISDFLYNAATGNLTQDQIDAQVQSETQALVESGVDPASAAQQASTDVSTTLSTFASTGGLGLSWTGALPSQPGFGTTATSAVTGAVGWLASNWIWILVAIAAFVLLGLFAYGGFGLG